MRQALKYIYHNIICFLLLIIGADVWLRRRSKNKRLIIMYHGVRKGSGRINGRHITAALFEKHLQYFQKTFSILPLNEICDAKVNDITNERHTISLTFDDGFLNNLTVALPLLEKYSIPATFFICTASITDPTYAHPTDRIDMIRVSKHPETIRIGDNDFLRSGHRVIGANNKHAYEYLNSLTYEKWLQANDDLRSQLDDSVVSDNGEVYTLLDNERTSTIAENPFATIGSHSHHHVAFTVLSNDEANYQLEQSKMILGSYGSDVDAIAFPYGSYDDKTIDAARRCGYKYLIAGGHVDPPNLNQVFPRVGVLDGAGFAYTMLMINNAFKRFGF